LPIETAAALNRWLLIKLTGWTDEYVESMPIGKIHMYLQIEDGYSKGIAKKSRLK